jgi:hypothetical protein
MEEALVPQEYGMEVMSPWGSIFYGKYVFFLTYIFKQLVIFIWIGYEFFYVY